MGGRKTTAKAHLGSALAWPFAEPEQVVRVRPHVRVREHLVLRDGAQTRFGRMAQRAELLCAARGSKRILDGHDLRLARYVHRIVLEARSVVKIGLLGGGGGEEEGRDEDSQVGGWGAGRGRAVARNVLRLAQPRDVRGDGGSTSRVMAVKSSEIEPAACRIEQQRLVFRVEQGQVSRVRVQSCNS